MIKRLYYEPDDMAKVGKVCEFSCGVFSNTCRLRIATDARVLVAIGGH